MFRRCCLSLYKVESQGSPIRPSTVFPQSTACTFVSLIARRSEGEKARFELSFRIFAVCVYIKLYTYKGELRHPDILVSKGQEVNA